MSGCVSKLGSVDLNSLTDNNNANSAALPRLCNSPVSEDFDDTPTPWPMSFSSADQGGGDNDDESEGLLSSCSSFDSSSDFGYSLKTIEEMQAYVNKRRKKKGKADKSIKPYNWNSWKDSDHKRTMATLPENDHSPSSENKTVTNRLIPSMVDGKVNESYAVMKKSEDPYDDFKKSMMEMILEKHLSESVDLENLLICFLSLNAKEHHDVIVEAFGEVWEELFSSKSKYELLSGQLPSRSVGNHTSRR